MVERNFPQFSDGLKSVTSDRPSDEFQFVSKDSSLFIYLFIFLVVMPDLEEMMDHG